MNGLFTDAELERLIEAFGNPMLIVRDERVTVVNEAFVRAFGYRRDELLGKSVLSFTAAEDFNHISELMSRRKSGELPDVNRFRVNVRDAHGQKRPVMVTTHVVRTADGGAAIVNNCTELPEGVRDLTLAEQLVQISAELASARTEEEVRATVERRFLDAHVRASFHRADGSGGLSPLGKTQGSAPPSLESAREAFRERRPSYVPARGSSFTVYVPVLRTDSNPELLVLEESSFETVHGSLLALFSRQLASSLESTRTFAELQHRNDELSLLLDLARTTAGTLDLAEVLDAACDYLVKLLDVSNVFIMLLDEKSRVLKAAAASAQWREFFRTVQIPLDTESIASDAARTGRPVFIEDTRLLPVYRKDLVEKFGEKALMALPLTMRNQLIGSVVVDDVRGPRRFTREMVALAEATVGQIALSVHNAQLYESLKDSYAELAATRAEMVKRERLAALGELSAIVAHEVRNPLGVIFNAVVTLRRLTGNQQDAGMMLDIVKEECERLNRIVGDLLDFSRPTGLSLELEDVAGLLKESIDAALTGQADGGFRVETDIGALPRLRVDRRLLRQAFVNVLVNALQAMPHGGTLKVHARVDESNRVRIDVADTGVGIPAEVRGRMFEPFFTTKAKGTGLGLAVVRRIIDDHKGEVTLDSEVGRGTTFSFHLPLP